MPDIDHESDGQVEDFVYITDSTYSSAEVLQMEVTVLNALRFNLTAVTPYCFLKRLTTVLGLDDQVSQRMSAHSAHMHNSHAVEMYSRPLPRVPCP